MQKQDLKGKILYKINDVLEHKIKEANIYFNKIFETATAMRDAIEISVERLVLFERKHPNVFKFSAAILNEFSVTLTRFSGANYIQKLFLTFPKTI